MQSKMDTWMQVQYNALAAPYEGQLTMESKVRMMMVKMGVIPIPIMTKEAARSTSPQAAEKIRTETSTWRTWTNIQDRMKHTDTTYCQLNLTMQY